MTGEEKADKALLDVVRRMPQEHCLRCGHAFPNRPDAERPYAEESRWDDRRHCRVRAGVLCRGCYDKARSG